MLQDTWALKAQREGYRSRAVYKLEEILVKVKYNNQSCKVLDIGVPWRLERLSDQEIS